MMNTKQKAAMSLFTTFSILLSFYMLNVNLENVKRIEEFIIQEEFITKNTSLKYILMWTSNTTVPFVYLNQGREIFQREQCQFTNCYITHDKNLLDDVSSFDAILFHLLEYNSFGKNTAGKPANRSPEQKYTVVAIESSHNYAARFELNDFFNWTWTYRLDSDISWLYMSIRDRHTGKLVGPKVAMEWRQDMEDLTEEEKEEFSKKKLAAAWFVSNCVAKSNRETFAKKLKGSLLKYGLRLDIFGRCGSMRCDDREECLKMLEDDYYFYLSFENSFTEDYVTEKFVNAMKHKVVPIVWGGADYSRFAPPGSYINAREIGDPDKLAEMMSELIKNPDEYFKYFRWRKYYSYYRDVEISETRAACKLCQALNDPVKMSERKSYSNIKIWWNSN